MSRIATKLVFIQRSDGKETTVDSRTRREEKNAPTSEQLTKTKGENGQWSYYHELGITDKRNYDWRKKLGGLLIETMAAAMKDKKEDMSKLNADKYVLAAFPENYRLYEHRRVANPDNLDERGAGDRSDVYLYGYPQGRKKRFRSPNDFFHHLLWLATDETADPENCQCKFCASDEAQKAFSEIEKTQRQRFGIKSDGQKQATRPGLAPQSRDRSSETVQTTPTTKITVEVPKRATAPSLSSAPPQPSKSPAPTAQLAQSPIITPPPPIVTPTPPVQPTNAEQVLDAQPSKFMFRPGEVVWYQRNSDRGGAVGLSVVTGRELMRDINRAIRAAYNVQPLSHPFHHPPVVLIKDEQLLKPWLAFSPPENFHESLRKINVAFDQIPWRQLLDGVYGEGDTEADGSIFAAKTVDASYTPFEVLSQTSTETKYNGVFLGGEKIWRGEALRLKNGNGKDIMILSEIVEKPASTASPTNGQQPTGGPELFFVGDLYSYRSNPQPTKQMPRNTYLPVRVQQDLEFRNSASMSRGKGTNYWKFIRPLARLTAAAIKGRWYESRSMIPILHSPDVLAQAVREGEVEDIGESLNSHGDSSAIVPAGQRRKATRLEAFGMAVPQSIVFGGGGITQREGQQQQQQQQQQGQGQGQARSPPQMQQGYARPEGQYRQPPQPPQQPQQQGGQQAQQEDVEVEMTDYADVNQGQGAFGAGYVG